MKDRKRIEDPTKHNKVNKIQEEEEDKRDDVIENRGQITNGGMAEDRNQKI